jgi:hypothetical protein
VQRIDDVSLRRATAFSLVLGLLAAGSALGADGAIEINQARALAGGITLGDTPGYPVTLSLPGEYVLTGDLSVANLNQSAIDVTSDDVTIDLRGFGLFGSANCNGTGTCTPGSGVGVLVIQREGVVIRSGTVHGFPGGGLYLFRVDGCQVENVTVTLNGSRGIEVGGSCVFSGVIVDRNQLAGIFHNTDDPVAADSPIDDVVTRESVISRNGQEGVFGLPGTGRERFSLVRSAVFSNGLFGIDLRTEGFVRDCAIFGNTGGGIRIGVNSLQADSGLLRGNAVRSNGGPGFILDPGHVGYTQNVFSGNTGASTGGVQMGTNVCEGDLICP